MKKDGRMDKGSWGKFIEFATANPDVIWPVTYWCVGALITIVGGAVWLTWFIRGAIAKGSKEAMQDRLELAKAQTEDTAQKLAQALDEGDKLRQQILAGPPYGIADEFAKALGPELAKVMGSLQNATTANTATMRIVTSQDWGQKHYPPSYPAQLYKKPPNPRGWT
jgi:hypothetical protein